MVGMCCQAIIIIVNNIIKSYKDNLTTCCNVRADSDQPLNNLQVTVGGRCHQGGVAKPVKKGAYLLYKLVCILTCRSPPSQHLSQGGNRQAQLFLALPPSPSAGTRRSGR